MTILTYKSHPVTVESVYPVGPDNELRATVKAVEGAPFVGGDKWPIPSPWTIAPLSELQPAKCTCKPDGDLCPACRESLAELYASEIPNTGR